MFVKTLLSIGWKNEPIGAWCTPDKHLDIFKLRICECESMNIFDSFKFNPVKIQVAATRGNENLHHQIYFENQSSTAFLLAFIHTRVANLDLPCCKHLGDC